MSLRLSTSMAQQSCPTKSCDPKIPNSISCISTVCLTPSSERQGLKPYCWDTHHCVVPAGDFSPFSGMRGVMDYSSPCCNFSSCPSSPQAQILGSALHWLIHLMVTHAEPVRMNSSHPCTGCLYFIVTPSLVTVHGSLCNASSAISSMDLEPHVNNTVDILNN